MGFFGSIFNGINTLVNGGKDITAPVEGVTFEAWSKVNASMASGTAVEDAVKSAGMDMPKWDRINAEWLTRMQNDRLRVLSFKYASEFKKNSSGNLGKGSEINADSYPFEKYVEVMAAMDILGQQGKDAQEVLKDFGLTVADYSNLSNYWSKQIMFSPFTTGMKFQELMMKYREQYQNMSTGDNNKDIQF